MARQNWCEPLLVSVTVCPVSLICDVYVHLILVRIFIRRTYIYWVYKGSCRRLYIIYICAPGNNGRKARNVLNSWGWLCIICYAYVGDEKLTSFALFKGTICWLIGSVNVRKAISFVEKKRSGSSRILALSQSHITMSCFNRKNRAAPLYVQRNVYRAMSEIKYHCWRFHFTIYGNQNEHDERIIVKLFLRLLKPNLLASKCKQTKTRFDDEQWGVRKWE